MSETAWEAERDWATMRPFVYYQLDNFVPAELVRDRDVVDFSAGLGDLSEYAWSVGPRSLTATAPEVGRERPDGLAADVSWVTGVGAERIAESLGAASADTVLARMVIQFPTIEDHGVDVDDILGQMREVLRPGGSVVVTTHSFFSFTSQERDADGLAALVDYLGLPPREGPFGATGYGLKIPMLVNSFVRSGFSIDTVDEIEPFTYPTDLDGAAKKSNMTVRELGNLVMDIKRRYLTLPEARDPYLRPRVLGDMLDEIRQTVSVTAVPIVRVIARRS